MKFRKKPVVVDAVQWTGANYVSIENFLGSPRNGAFTTNGSLILTSNGHVFPGHWVIRDEHGNFYPCQKDIFAATYEAVPE